MKNKIIISVACILIIFGLFGLSDKLSQKPKVETVAPKIVYIKLWELKLDVNSGRKFSRDMVVMKNIPEAKANELGFYSNISLDFLKGTIVKRDLKVGTIITPEDIISPGQNGYVAFIISENHVPYPISINESMVIGGIIQSGDFVDILAFNGGSQRVNNNVATASSRIKQSISVTPVFTKVRVLEITRKNKVNVSDDSDESYVTLILELDRKEAVTLTLAKRISEIEVHKSIGKYDISELHADAGDILPDFDSVVEYRADKTTIN